MSYLLVLTLGIKSTAESGELYLCKAKLRALSVSVDSRTHFLQNWQAC